MEVNLGQAAGEGGGGGGGGGGQVMDSFLCQILTCEVVECLW